MAGLFHAGRYEELAPETMKMIGEKQFALMKPGAIYLNAARAALHDVDALVDALESGHLAGAALDVFETEPLPADSPLRGLPNVILGSHNASNTVEAVRRVNRLAIDNLLAVLEAVRA